METGVWTMAGPAHNSSVSSFGLARCLSCPQSFIQMIQN